MNQCDKKQLVYSVLVNVVFLFRTIKTYITSTQKSPLKPLFVITNYKTL